jgi:c-di-GMP-binding flagellar brake protein YcgR
METRKERREFFRVDGRVFLYYRKLSKDEKKGLLQGHLIDEEPPVTTIRREGNEEKAATQSRSFDDFDLEELRTRLQRLEEKLDLIIQELSTNRPEEEDVHFEPCFVNISGSGMRLPTRERFDVGDCLEIRVLLPIMPNRPIRLLGEVVHVMDSPERIRKIGRNQIYGTGVQFISLLEEDRQRIVQYTFHRQASEIRDLRSNLPS